MDVTLEYLKHADLAAYQALMSSVSDGVKSLEELQASYKEDHPYVKVVVAKKENEIIGTITFVLIDTFMDVLDPKLEFSSFAVSPAARGTDTAKLLIDFMVDYGKRNGYRSIAVNCFPDAPRAHSFYKKVGFKPLDRARFILEIDG